MSKTQTRKNQKVVTHFATYKKLIVLSIILLTCLSATLLKDITAAASKKEVIIHKTKNTTETPATKKIRSFDAKNYLKDYEHKKKAKKMLIDSMEREIK